MKLINNSLDLVKIYFMRSVSITHILLFELFIALCPNHGHSQVDSTISQAPEPSKGDHLNNAVQTALLDLDHIITSQERADWILDREAIKHILPRGAEVICQLTNSARASLIEQLKTDRDKRKSSVEEWHNGGERDSRAHRAALHQDRIWLLAQATMRRIDECPHWLPPRDDFLGVHRDAGRLQLLAETMGGGQLQRSGDETLFGGSAQGRLFGVYGFGVTWGVGLGVELGVSSLFPKDERGQRSVKAQWTAGVPLLYRAWIDNVRLDAEVALVARFEDSTDLSGIYGARVAFAAGVNTLRIFGALPHLMLWVGSETYLPATHLQRDASLSDPSSLTHIMRIGTRIGVSL